MIGLPNIFEDGAFAEVTLHDTLYTIHGTMGLYSTVKPDES
jgi:hypothetical protein